MTWEDINVLYKNNHNDPREVVMKLFDMINDFEKEIIVLDSLMRTGEQRGIKKATDDFKSRVCENCIHFSGSTCQNMLSIGWWCDEGVRHNDTCGRFERKTD